MKKIYAIFPKTEKYFQKAIDKVKKRVYNVPDDTNPTILIFI